MTDYNSQLKILERFESFLKKMNINYTPVDVMLKEGGKRAILLIPYTYDDLIFDTTITVESMEGADDWVSINCYAFDIGEIEGDPKKLNQILKIVMSLNFDIPETSFALFNDKYLYIKSDMRTDIDFDDFEFEANGLSWGLSNLFDKLRVLGYKIDPTKGKLPLQRV
jgi:hypothetical protein